MVQAQLSSLTRDFTATSAAAQRTLKGLFGRRPPSPVVDVDAVPTAQLRPGYGASAGRSAPLPAVQCVPLPPYPPVFPCNDKPHSAHCALSLEFLHACRKT